MKEEGQDWAAATMEEMQNKAYTWVPWSYNWTVLEKGEYTILSRAADSAGRTQPLEPFWNRKGYGYNAVLRVRVKVE
ncbi:MAG: hypothetical protein ACE3JN_04045 [Ectobacillus sp.]